MDCLDLCSAKTSFPPDEHKAKPILNQIVVLPFSFKFLKDPKASSLQLANLH
jgi:hypothetical protein